MDQFKAEALHEHSQAQLGFHQGEILSDADARATAKGSRTDPDPEQLKLTHDLLERLAINGLDDPSLTGAVHERTSAYRAMVHALMTALQGCPTDRAYPILLAATLKAKDPIIREKLAKRVVQLARQDPDLPALPPAYP